MNVPAQHPPRPPFQRRVWSRALAGIVAGFLAILVNTALLIIADRFHVVTARGGLLTLLLTVIGRSPPPITMTWAFQQFFHILVGVAMATVYAVFLGDWHATAITKGLLTAAAVWLANACVVLPMIGQGFAGFRVLTSFGMVTFAVAHTIFFVLTALLYERLMRSR